MIIKLLPSQTQACLYPLTCPVWLFSRDPLYDDITKCNSFKRGTVTSASLNLVTKQTLYEVKIHGDKTVSVAEEEMGFGSGCAVKVDGELSGTVLLCKRNERGVVYTVRFEGRFEDNVHAERVRYRKIEGEAIDDATTNISKSKEEVASNVEQVTPQDKCTPDDENSKQMLHPAVPSAIVCEASPKSDTKLSDTTSLSESRNTVSTSGGKRKHDTDHGSHSQGKYSRSTQNHQLRIVIPPWLQKDSITQRRLFFHFIQGNLTPHADTIRKIQHDTQCKIHLNYNSHSTTVLDPITIDIDHHLRTPSNRFLILARRRIEDILANFYVSGLPLVRDDGSIGRLMYEIAACCGGPHKPKEARYAVQQANPFDGHRKQCFMSLLELPFTVNKVNRIYHGHFLTEGRVVERVNRETGCTFRLVGDDFGTPTRYCDPYVFVTGHQWAKVDQAVDMLKKAIWQHQKGCACSR